MSPTSLHIVCGTVLVTMKSSPNTVINIQFYHWQTLKDGHAEQDVTLRTLNSK